MFARDPIPVRTQLFPKRPRTHTHTTKNMILMRSSTLTKNVICSTENFGNCWVVICSFHLSLGGSFYIYIWQMCHLLISPLNPPAPHLCCSCPPCLLLWGCEAPTLNDDIKWGETKEFSPDHSHSDRIVRDLIWIRSRTPNLIWNTKQIWFVHTDTKLKSFHHYSATSRPTKWRPGI